ncbi:MAG TPA: isoprenylcysteine carboxylmethyltransferase family protein [Actinomycetales bacterium]|nr:isoprenylcysteine carboxylmethyltransferase family protein [Actinomycetales bacterium]
MTLGSGTGTGTGTGAPAHGADVRVVPPALFAASFAAGALADRWWHLPAPTGRGTRVAAATFLTAGTGLAAWGAATFRRHHTTVIPHKPVSSFVTSGPYRFTRNPMYAGMAFAYTGATLALGTAWPLLTMPAALIAVRRLVIDREERYLTDRFGTDYEAYRTRVRRWL